MTDRVVELYYDVVCPFAYLGSTQIEALAARTGARVVFRPMLLGGVFKALGAPADLTSSMPEAKRRHNERDMHRWAAHWGVPLVVPAQHPRSTVLAMRAILAAGEPSFARATHALYRAYWVEERDVTVPEVVAGVLDGAGLDGSDIATRATSQPIKDDLRARTDEAVSRGVFGAPTFFVGGEMYWGQDRLGFVEAALGAQFTVR